MSRRRRLAYARAQAARAAQLAEARRPGLVYVVRVRVVSLVRKWAAWLLGRDVVMIQFEEIEK